MKSLKLITYLIISGALFFPLSACSDSISPQTGDSGNSGTESTQYVIAASSGENSYLLQTSNIKGGSVSAQDKEAIQILGNRTWIFYKDVSVFGFKYAKGKPGRVSAFVLGKQGQLKELKSYGISVSMQAFGTYNDHLVFQYSSRSYKDPQATFYKINGYTGELLPRTTVKTDTLAPDNEIAYFTDIAQYGDYILASYRPISGGSNGMGTFESNHYNETFIAVYDKNFNPVKVIHDKGRTGAVAGQSRSQGRTGIEVVESGDVYLFSSAIETTEVPSGVLKINEGELKFDDSYFFNISKASGGYDLYRVYYMGATKFIVRMYDDQATANPKVTKTGFAVVDVAAKTFTWVKDMPSNITSISDPYIDKANNHLLVGIKTKDTRPHVYTIDPETATITQGKEVKADAILRIGKLNIQ